MSAIPFEITSTLRDSLTERGIEQWWTGRNRRLGERVPCDVWERDPDAVIAAAEKFGVGYDFYV
jgi:hypothetical protein